MQAWFPACQARGWRRSAAGRNYRGLVVVLCLAVAVEWGAARRLVVAFPEAFAGVDGSEPDDTRVECFARCLTVFLGAASAIEPRKHTATTATSSMFIVLRIMESPLFLSFRENSILDGRNHSAPALTVQRKKSTSRLPALEYWFADEQNVAGDDLLAREKTGAVGGVVDAYADGLEPLRNRRPVQLCKVAQPVEPSPENGLFSLIECDVRAIAASRQHLDCVVQPSRWQQIVADRQSIGVVPDR